MNRLTVIGGSSPFTVGLIDALLGQLHPHHLVLHGRSQRKLDLVRSYAAAHLQPAGWVVGATTNLVEAVAGARFVIHQARYGGLEGRDEDEQLAAAFGAVVDETLGPGALNSALRLAPQLRSVARAVAVEAPQAWLLNLTNPVSIAVAILAREGVRQCVGLCELPSITARAIAGLLELPPDRLSWHYRGLNHRGFLVGLECDRSDLLPALLRGIGKGGLGGVGVEVIAELEAVPTKYFTLIQGHRGPAPGRARYLRTVGERIWGELAAAPHASPRSLKLRQLPWYSECMVPVLSSLLSAGPGRHVVNLCGSDGLVREMHASISSAGLDPEPAPLVSLPVHQYLARFEEHDRRTLEAVVNPLPETIEAALRADPTVEPAAVSGLTRELCRRHLSRSAAEAGVT